jgi:alpha-L-rhamnosidase
MFDEATNKKAVNNLKSLVERRDYCISTGFPGTPYILYALADNGEVETAYKMLLNTKCPSWLYEVRVGGTTIWERWDGLDENGQANLGDDGTHGMISFNHYAAGSVGNFLYTRLVGLEPVEAGYKKFRVKPVLTPEISYAKAKTLAPYGEIKAGWRKENNEFIVDVEVPIGTECDIYLPSGKVETVKNGKYTIKEQLN